MIEKAADGVGLGTAAQKGIGEKKRLRPGGEEKS